MFKSAEQHTTCDFQMNQWLVGPPGFEPGTNGL